MNSFFLFDVIVNFFTAYEDNDLVIHDSLKDIAINNNLKIIFVD